MRLYSQRCTIKTGEASLGIIPVDSNIARVAIVRANNYDVREIKPAIQRSLDLIGGLEGLVKPGDKVFVKINHLSPPSPAASGIVTHPVFVEAVLEILKETGAVITVGDDVEADGEDGFAVSGFRQMCQRTGVKLANLREAGFIATRFQGRILPEIYLSRIALEADFIINLPKLKTHSLTTFTGGIKNLYGVIPAGLRRRFHSEYVKTDDFCQVLVDIFAAARPHLSIMDGIVTMEGEGPGSGHLRKLGLILTSRDTVALDAVAGSLIGLAPQQVLTTRYAAERGLGTGDLKSIQIVGESLAAVTVPDFKLPAATSQTAISHAPRWLVRFAISQISPRPRVLKKNCIQCEACVKACPTGAATITGQWATINDSLCIRCMCCHEVCRSNAIVPRRPFAGQVIYGLVNGARSVLGK